VKGDEMSRAQRKYWWKKEMLAGFWWGNMEERGCLED